MHFLQDFGQEKCSFVSNTVYIEKCTYMVNIANSTELNWQICNYAQKRRICRKNSNCAGYDSFLAIFALATLSEVLINALFDLFLLRFYKSQLKQFATKGGGQLF